MKCLRKQKNERKFAASKTNQMKFGLVNKAAFNILMAFGNQNSNNNKNQNNNKALGIALCPFTSRMD